MNKKIKICLMAAMFALTFTTFEASAKEAAPKTTTIPDAGTKVRVLVMESRIYEINKMDKSNLTPSEKRALRNEVKDINEQMKIADGGGVYLSAGAVILIVILLIILL